jgi:hypothetical protein
MRVTLRRGHRSAVDVQDVAEGGRCDVRAQEPFPREVAEVWGVSVARAQYACFQERGVFAVWGGLVVGVLRERCVFPYFR